VPDTLSEYAFAGLLRGGKTEVTKCIGSDLQVPAGSVLELAADELIATVSETKQAHAEELATDAEGAAGEAAAEGDSSESAESAE
jgi:hypothetical protein